MVPHQPVQTVRTKVDSPGYSYGDVRQLVLLALKVEHVPDHVA